MHRTIFIIAFLLFGPKAAAQSLETYWDTVKVMVSPYFINIVSNGKSVVLAGTNHHFKDPADKMFADIEERMRLQAPTLVMIEHAGFVNDTKEESIANGGDVSWCKYLAIKNNIAVTSWAAPWSDIYYELLKKYKTDPLHGHLQSLLFLL